MPAKFFTRDNPLWNVLFVLGGVLSIALAPVTDPASYGLSLVQLNWLKLVATALVASGKLASSPAPHSEEGDAKITMSGR